MTERKQFGNGVVLITDHWPSSTGAEVYVGLKMGSVYEPPELNGSTHVIEHMLFKSNQHRTCAQINEQIEYLGVQQNAFTHFDRMVFTGSTYLTDGIPELVRIVHEAFINPTYLTDEFERERGVVQEELRNDKDDAGSYFSTHLTLPFLFRGTPMERTIGGPDDFVGRLRKEDLEAFKARFYTPENICITAVGGFDQKALEQVVAETFATMPSSGRGRQPSVFVSTENLGGEKVVHRKGTDQAYLGVSYRIPPHTNDTAALIVLEGICSAGMSGRMFTEFREKRGIGYSPSAGYWALEPAGMFTFQVPGYLPERTDEARTVMRQVIDGLMNEKPSERELERVKRQLRSRGLRSLERRPYHANSLIEEEFHEGPSPFKYTQELAAVEAVTSDDVLRVAQKYLTDKHATTLLLPESA